MLLQDLRYAARSVLRNPGFTAVAVLCLSLGIGLNAAIFSVVDGVLLQPYPYPETDRIVVLHTTNQRARINRAGVSWLDYKDWRDQNTTFSSMAAFTGRTLTISDGTAEPERFSGSTVSWNLFGLLGTPPAVGCDFGPDDDRLGAEPVVMLSDECGSAVITAIGRSSAARFPSTLFRTRSSASCRRASCFLRRSASGTGRAVHESMARNVRAMQLFGRMKPGVSQEQALEDLRGIAGRLAITYPPERGLERARPSYSQLADP
jgi:hypothetical protein